MTHKLKFAILQQERELNAAMNGMNLQIIFGWNDSQAHIY